MAQEDDLKTKVTSWLNGQGYPLEMRVASTLQKDGFRVVQSEYFADPDTGVSRELDVAAFKQIEIENVLFRVSLLIECKHSTDKPWLLFSSDKTRLADPARVAQRAANSLGGHFLREVCQSTDVQSLSLFSLPKRPAYGVTQALTTGKDVCYSAVTSVSKAALATVAELDERKETEKKNLRMLRRTSGICSIVFPVVVVEGKLFEVFLDDSTNVVVDDVDNGTLLWRNPVVGMPHTIVNIVSSSSFEHFSHEALVAIDRLFELTEKQLTESIKRAIERENRPPIRMF
jgi:hypothetical protein